MLIRWKSKEKSASSSSGGNSKKKRKGREGGKGSCTLPDRGHQPLCGERRGGFHYQLCA